MVLRQIRQFVVVASIALICSAHIGSPDAWYSGPAGPYQVLVHVKAPAVVPGIAVISIKPETQVATITAFVNKYDAVAGGPPPDVATPVADNPGWFRTDLWVMDPGSNSVTVSLRGGKGEGTVVVPLVAVAARRLQVNGVLSVVLVAAALILVAGLLTVVGAAVRESVLPPGTEPDANRRKRARAAMLRSAVVVIAVFTGLGAWWRAEDSAFAQNLFKPLRAVARTEFVEGVGQRLVFAITDSAWTQRNSARRTRARGGSEFSELVEDHHKLMHMFVIAADGQAGFAHLHPSTTDSTTFTATLPPLPAGRYRVFADIVHSTGLTQTLATSVTLEAPRARVDVQLSDADDAWIADGAAGDGAASVLSDSTAVAWLGAAAPHVAGEEAGLRFSIAPPAGDTSPLEPYLGMLGHAAVVRDDGAVFIHLHPLGTISVAAQTMLSHAPEMTHAMSWTTSGDTLYFPYAFPSAGSYTMWVQVKRHGRVQTAVFRARVTAAGSRGSGRKTAG